MFQLLRVTALVLVLLFESLVSAFAMLPGTEAPPVAMPCHEHVAAGTKVVGSGATMPCCGDSGACHCDAGCPGTASPLIPAFAGLVVVLERLPVVRSHSTVPAPAHRLRLLRPPAVLES